MNWLQRSKYGYLWLTLIFFGLSLVGHWLFGWFAYVNEQHALKASISVADCAVQMSRDTFENWQSEFLQLMWQVGGLAVLLYVGSPQSREAEERTEAKLDAILETVDRKSGKKRIAAIDRKFLRS
jgi:hypothetical protein